MACLYYENISFSPILSLPGPELPKWVNGGPILVFMMLKYFSLISTEEKRSNDYATCLYFETSHFDSFWNYPMAPRGISILQMG